jgi:hypothetical protein
MVAYIKSTPDSKFTYHEFLCDLYIKQQSASDLISTPTSQISRSNHKKLFENGASWIESHSQEIDRYLDHHGFDYKLVPSRIDTVGRGNQVKYGLTIEPIDTTIMSHETDYHVPEGGVKFIVEGGNASWWVRSTDISLAGIKKWWFVILALSPVLIPLYLLSDYQILLLPSLLAVALLPITIPLLIMVYSGVYLRMLKRNSLMFIGSDNKGERHIRFRTYTGVCSVCGGDLLLEDIGWIFTGNKRLIASCTENSARHNFTIDHVTNVGERAS